MISEDIMYILEKEGIKLEWMDLKHFAGVYIKIEDLHIIVLNNNLKSQREIRLTLLHELGHFFTGTFYKHEMEYLYIDKCEYKALKWATTFLMPKQEVEKAIKKGIKEVWELAEYFDVPEEWVRFRLNLPDIKNLNLCHWR